MPSTWANQNAQLFAAMPGFVFLHSTDPGYKFLAVKPDLSEGRLNRPIADLIGQPLRVTDEAIALPKERAIASAIATKGDPNIHLQSSVAGSGLALRRERGAAA